MSEENLLPLTRAEETGKKPLRLVRAAARIAIVARWPEGNKCLLVRHQMKGFELPGGAIEPGENPLQAGLRELGEEAGIQLPSNHLLTLIAMTPIIDHRGGSWLDIIYGTMLALSQISQQQEPELPVSWLTVEEIEGQVHDRWIEWYQNLTRRYGGHDMGEWHVGYDQLDEEWENLLALFDWCTAHDRYDVMRSFWRAEEPGSVVDFTHLYGYWDDRLIWLNWLMGAAERRADWPTMLDTIASIANTMALMDRYSDAEDLFKRGQRLNMYANPEVQVRLLINHAYLYIFMEYFDKADCLLDQARTIAPQLQEPLRTRENINIDYDYAAVLYWRGDLYAAKAAFTKAKEQAEDFGWQSLANYARNYVADIEREQGNHDEAERLLELGLMLAERNYDTTLSYTYHATKNNKVFSNRE